MAKSNKQIAIVTGGASGLGLAIAKKFTENNIYTIVIGRDKNKLTAAKKLLGANCETISFDITVLKDIPALIQKIFKKYGRIDILVNNAGINMKKLIPDVTDEDFQLVMNTNVNSLFSMSREVIKVMEKQG